MPAGTQWRVELPNLQLKTEATIPHMGTVIVWFMDHPSEQQQHSVQEMSPEKLLVR